jgi:hypothetical protein
MVTCIALFYSIGIPVAVCDVFLSIMYLKAMQTVRCNENQYSKFGVSAAPIWKFVGWRKSLRNGDVQGTARSAGNAKPREDLKPREGLKMKPARATERIAARMMLAGRSGRNADPAQSITCTDACNSRRRLRTTISACW